MQGWKIFTHSMRMVFGNLAAALRISGLLYLLYVAVNLYMMQTFGDEILALQISMAEGNFPTTLADGLAEMMLLNMFTIFLISLWISVLWHRYVLLEEVPNNFIPPLHGPLLVAYLAKTIKMILILIAVGLVVGLASGLVLSLAAGATGIAFMPLIVLGVIMYFSYRLGLVLPAAALNKSMTFAQSWAATKPAAGAIGQLAAIAISVIIIIQIPSNLNPDPKSVINLAYSYVLGWFAMMVSASFLNTLYGIYAEGREL